MKTCTSDAEDIRSRFFHEAQIAGNLQHRNITTVYDFGVVDSVPFLVQEYLTGEDLDRKIKRKEFLPYPEKLLYLVQSRAASTSRTRRESSTGTSSPPTSGSSRTAPRRSWISASPSWRSKKAASPRPG